MGGKRKRVMKAHYITLEEAIKPHKASCFLDIIPDNKSQLAYW